jgi:hypothetical protein
MLATLGTGAIFAVWYFTSEGRISEANFIKIQDNMTQADVEALFGGPPTSSESATRWYADGWRLKMWSAGRASARVLFDDVGKVRLKWYSEPSSRLLDTIRRLLRL